MWSGRGNATFQTNKQSRVRPTWLIWRRSLTGLWAEQVVMQCAAQTVERGEKTLPSQCRHLGSVPAPFRNQRRIQRRIAKKIEGAREDAKRKTKRTFIDRSIDRKMGSRRSLRTLLHSSHIRLCLARSISSTPHLHSVGWFDKIKGVFTGKSTADSKSSFSLIGLPLSLSVCVVVVIEPFDLICGAAVIWVGCRVRRSDGECADAGLLQEVRGRPLQRRHRLRSVQEAIRHPPLPWLRRSNGRGYCFFFLFAGRGGAGGQIFLPIYQLDAEWTNFFVISNFGSFRLTELDCGTAFFFKKIRFCQGGSSHQSPSFGSRLYSI